MVKNMRSCRVVVLCAFVAFLFVAGKGYSEESVTARENLEKLIKTNSCRGCFLSGLNLNRVDLSDADLEGADLSKTKMYLANLSRANLRDANLRGTLFGGADLADADLRGADLRGTSLDGAYLGGTLLDGTFVTTKPYENVGVSEIEKEVYVADQSKPKRDPKAKEIVVAPRRVFEEPPPALPVKVVEEKIVEKESYPQAPKVKKLTPMAPVAVAEELAPQADAAADGADENMVSTGRGETNRNLAGNKKKRDELARLSDTKKCYDCDLSGMDLSNRNLTGVDLEKSNLTGCNFENADLEKANLKGASLIQANLRGANLKKADLYRADLTNADLTGANTTETLFDSAKLSGTVGLVQPVDVPKK